jgi:hypothetical protein
MGDPVRKPAKTSPAKPASSSRAAARRPRAKSRVCELVDFAVTRLLALAVVVAVARGQASPELAAVLWAVSHLLKRTRRR